MNTKQQTETIVNNGVTIPMNCNDTRTLQSQLQEELDLIEIEYGIEIIKQYK